MKETLPIASPGLYDVFQGFRVDILRSLNCVKIGQILSFDGTKKTAQIQILFKLTKRDGTIADYPKLVDCPVFTLQGGGAAIQMPIAAGDNCIVLFADRNIDNWYGSGAADVPANNRTHDLSDGIAIVGINALNSSLAGNPANTMRISYGNAKIDWNAGDLKMTNSSGAEIDLASAKISIKNASTTLLTVIDGLIDVIKALTIQGPSAYPLTTAAIATLETYKTNVAALLS
jgi:hypothetical protein